MLISSTANPVFDAYYADLNAYAAHHAAQEQTTRLAFTKLLDAYAKPAGWTLLLEKTLDTGRKRPDGTLQDTFKIPRGYWEAKDTKDDLDAEITAKIKIGYPTANTIFEDTRRGVLYQNRQRVLEADLRQPAELAGLLTRFFGHTEEQIEEFHTAVATFGDRIPDLAHGLKVIIGDALTDNPAFAGAFDDFHTLCKGALNPGLRRDAIEEMLVQHLLTERLFRTVLSNAEFTKRNVIAAEIEKVIAALTSRSFSRGEFLKALDYFYLAIENEARTITTYAEKQGFLNTVYERFFQGFSKGQADTHGIVYTPQPIVDFMCESVEHVLRTEFGTSLSDKGVVILDPCTGTGNFLVNLLRRVAPLNLTHKYQHELFANEVMLLPYYIASLNIEHAYYEVMGQYRPFDGICFADTLDLAEAKQLAMFSEQNTERVQREKDAAVTVIIGNPPYNVGQKNENDNNKNRTYAVVDNRIKQTYVKDSKATLQTKLYDAYVRFFRWATDRLGDRDGVVCFVTNNSFVDQFAFDGMRKHLLQDFTQVYHLDLHGNVRKNPKLSGTTHNVFGIQVGAGITVAVRKAGAEKFLRYHRVPEDWRKTEKLAWLVDKGSITGVEWQTLEPNAKQAWLTEGLEADFEVFLPIASKETKTSKSLDVDAIFKTYSLGVSTNRDSIVYDFSKEQLISRVRRMVSDYNAEIHRWQAAGRPKDTDAFLTYDRIKWSNKLKEDLKRAHFATFDENCLRFSVYRPFMKQWLYYNRLFNDGYGQFDNTFPSDASDNLLICLTGPGSEKPFMAGMTQGITDLHFVGSGAGTQCFPLYTYALDGKLRRDNITDWALAQFQDAYGPAVTKRDIFHYVYALLHHPEYRARYKENLKRELPRVPLVGKDRPLAPNSGGTGGEGAGAVFWEFVTVGAELAALHVGYEDAAEYPLTQVVNKDVPFSWRVVKMRLTPDRTAIKVNESLTLGGVPPEAFGYTLGNRSALEWVLDQYQVTADKRSGIVSDPNRADAPEYIARLIGRVVTVSVETVRLVASLPPLAVGDAPAP